MSPTHRARVMQGSREGCSTRVVDDQLDVVVREIMEAQADLQTALGFIRLQTDERFKNVTTLTLIEERATLALARLHSLLDTLGNPMFHPVEHPDIDPGPRAVRERSIVAVSSDRSALIPYLADGSRRG